MNILLFLKVRSTLFSFSDKVSKFSTYFSWINSSSWAIPVSNFALWAFVIIPFSPMIAFKETPASIRSTIIVKDLLYDEKNTKKWMQT